MLIRLDVIIMAVFISVHVYKVSYGKELELLLGRLCLYVHLANMLSGVALNRHCIVLCKKKGKQNRNLYTYMHLSKFY
jgi:hypothetical protein